MPIWNGEFGPVYQNRNDGIPNWEKINDERYDVLQCQLDIYNKTPNTSWSIWLWKGESGVYHMSLGIELTYGWVL